MILVRTSSPGIFTEWWQHPLAVVLDGCSEADGPCRTAYGPSGLVAHSTPEIPPLPWTNADYYGLTRLLNMSGSRANLDSQSVGSGFESLAAHLPRLALTR